jgi:hypothetical protein
MHARDMSPHGFGFKMSIMEKLIGDMSLACIVFY